MIKPIETHYKGYRFRSRLEARWAVFFDALGIDWEYEAEGYDLGEHGWYLPDFRINTGTSEEKWVEVKPLGYQIDERDVAIMKQFATIDTKTGFSIGPLVLVAGDPGKYDLYKDGVFKGRRRNENGNNGFYMCPRCGCIGFGEPPFSCGFSVDTKRVWIGCQKCDPETPCGGDNTLDPRDRTTGYPPSFWLGAHKGYIVADLGEYFSWYVEQAQTAVIAARSARF